MTTSHRLSAATSALLAFAFVFTASAVEQNELANPGFEEGFRHWVHPVKWRVEDGAGYDRSRGLVWENDDPEFYEYPTQDVPVETGVAYRLEVLVKVDELTGGKAPSIGVQWRTPDNKWAGSYYARPYDDNGLLKDGWERWVCQTPPVAPGVARGILFCSVPRGGVGKVRVDDISYVKGEVKTVVYFISSAHRDEAASGTVSFWARLYADSAKSEAVLEYVDGKGAARTAAPTGFDDAHAEFSLSVKDLQEGEQTVRFFLKDKGSGRMLGSAERVFTRLAAPRKRHVSFDAHGRMLVDGKKFFPVGHFINGGMKDEDLAEYCRSPHNFALMYDRTTVSELDRLHAAGILVAVDVRSLIYGYDYGTKSTLKTLDECRAALREKFGEIGSHPALAMWYLNDEAPISLAPNVENVHAFLHEIDSEHPTATCLCHPSTVSDFLPSADLMMLDCYPIGNKVGKNQIERVARSMREMNAGIASMRPLWFVPQAFNWGWFKVGESRRGFDETNLRMPSREELANMTWQGIACGANGIVFFSYRTIRVYAKKGEEYDNAWGDVCSVANEVKRMESVLLSDGLPMMRNELPEAIVARAWRHAGADWYLVVNATRERACGMLRLGHPVTGAKTVLGGGASLSPDGMALVCSFAPLEYAFVRIGSRFQ